MKNPQRFALLTLTIALCWGGVLWMTSPPSGSAASVAAEEDYILSNSRSLQRMITCSEFATGTLCLRRYQHSVLQELQDSLSKESLRGFQDCLVNAAKDKKQSGVLFKVGRCVQRANFDSQVPVEDPVEEKSETEKSETTVPSFFGFAAEGLARISFQILVLSSCLLLLVPLVIAGIMDSDPTQAVKEKLRFRLPDETTESAATELETQSRYGEEQPHNRIPDLDDNFAKWPQMNSASPLEPTSTTTTTTATTTSASYKARTDINIHDASKPVPSVLHFPKRDHRGKLLHRVFIPGRGWLSIKELENERREILAQLQLSLEKEKAVSPPAAGPSPERRPYHEQVAHIRSPGVGGGSGNGQHRHKRHQKSAVSPRHGRHDLE